MSDRTKHDRTEMHPEMRRDLERCRYEATVELGLEQSIRVVANNHIDLSPLVDISVVEDSGDRVSLTLTPVGLGKLMCILEHASAAIDAMAMAQAGWWPGPDDDVSETPS